MSSSAAPRRILYDLPFADAQALIDAFRARDQRAIAEVYRQHVDAVTRVIQRVLGHDTERDDLVQEVFVHAVEGAASFRGAPEQLGPWLRSIAVNRARRLIRRRRRRRWLSFADPRALPEPSAPDSPELEAAMARVYALLERMRTDERLVFALRKIDGQTLPEIAACCGLSLATVKRRLTRAQQRFELLARRDPLLRHWLGDADEDGTP